MQHATLNTSLNTADTCHAMVAAAGFAEVTVQTAQHHQFTTDPDTRFAHAWGMARRFAIPLPPADMDILKEQYRRRLQALLPNQQRWNHDFEQFVVA